MPPPPHRRRRPQVIEPSSGAFTTDGSYKPCGKNGKVLDDECLAPSDSDDELCVTPLAPDRVNPTSSLPAKKDFSWNDACLEAGRSRKHGKSILRGDPPPWLKDATWYQHHREASVKIGLELATFALAGEFYHAHHLEVSDMTYKVSGRCQYPRFKVVPILPRIDGDDRFSFGHPEANWWGTLSAGLHELAKLQK